MTERFIDATLSDFQRANYVPIFGYQDSKTVTLYEAVQPFFNLVPSLRASVNAANQNFTRSQLMNDNESAAIYLYTMGTDFFGLLNDTLRKSDRNALKPWFPYLKLLIDGLEKLPSHQCTIWRGITENIQGNEMERARYADGQIVSWWSVNSCSAKVAVSGVFTGMNGTVFLIECQNGKDIREFSAFAEAEEEILLMPGTRFRVKSTAFGTDHHHFIVHLEEYRIAELELRLPSPNGKRIWYKGEVDCQLMPHGQGECRWLEGDPETYSGEWVHGQRSGLGTLIRADGERLRGRWKNDKLTLWSQIGCLVNNLTVQDVDQYSY